jgi:uncharacterized membrane protein
VTHQSLPIPFVGSTGFRTQIKPQAYEKMSSTLIPFFGTGVGMVAVDLLYLAARQTYHDDFFASVQGSPLKVRVLAGVVVYALFAIAVFFAAGNVAKNMNDAVLRGAIVGAIMYGFYDATNYATLSRWTLEMAFVDTLWGSVLGAIGGALAYYLKTRF